MQQDNSKGLMDSANEVEPEWNEFPEAPPQGASTGKTEDLKGQLKEAGRDTLRRTKEQGEAMIDERKHQLAETMHHCSDALHKAADSLRDKQDPNLASFADTIADRLDRTSNYLDRKQFQDVRNDLENFARQQPQVFYGAMFVAGLALSRFLKASQPERETQGNFNP